MASTYCDWDINSEPRSFGSLLFEEGMPKSTGKRLSGIAPVTVGIGIKAFSSSVVIELSFL
jgi:hypothetical protein